jgi:hypothetical protein
MGSRGQLFQSPPGSELIFRTVTPLGAGATFTSPVFDVSGFKRIVGESAADNGATGVVQVEQSYDGLVFPMVSIFPTNTNAVSLFELVSFNVLVTGTFARFVYVDDGVGQASFDYASRGQVN